MLQKKSNIFPTEKNVRADVIEEKPPKISSLSHVSCTKIDLYTSICVIQDIRKPESAKR